MTGQAILTVAFSAAAAALASLAVLQTAPATPPRAVVAFDAPEGCPVGWAEYAAADGRMLVGAGEGLPHLSTGGHEVVLWEDLGLMELPVFQSYSGGGGSLIGSPEYEAEHTSHMILGSLRYVRSGGSVKKRYGFANIPTMPPFIALRFCTKT